MMFHHGRSRVTYSTEPWSRWDKVIAIVGWGATLAAFTLIVWLLARPAKAGTVQWGTLELREPHCRCRPVPNTRHDADRWHFLVDCKCRKSRTAKAETQTYLFQR